ncbi:MAG TPA: GTP-binding protein [Steroidobacteraceae bacterium]
MDTDHSARADPHTPVTLLTGFLGSGKTTLMNRALKHPVMARTAVVINEFGAIAIDHALTTASNDTILVLENGCLCCTVFGDLVQTLNRLYHAREAGELSFDQVLIETSGLADPAPVLQAFLSEPTLEGLYRVTAVVATIDAVNGADTLTEHAVSVRQVALADHLLLTKLDLLAADERAAVQAALSARLRRLNPSAGISAADDPQLDVLPLLRQPLPEPGTQSQAMRGWLAANAAASVTLPVEHSHHDSIASFHLVREAPLPREALTLLLNSLEKHLGPCLLRVKGLVNVSEEPQQPAVIQGAQHLLHNLTWLERWPDADHRTRIVFITQGIAPAELAELVNLLERVAQRTANARLRAAGPRAAADAEMS